MGSVFPDNVVSDGAKTGPPAQMPNGLEELRVQRQGKAIVFLSLQGQTVHLPAAKLPAMSHKHMLNVSKGHTTHECCMQAHMRKDTGPTHYLKLHTMEVETSESFHHCQNVTRIWELFLLETQCKD